MDDEDGEVAPVAKKVDEVDSLMQKYEDEDKHEEYMKTPEYKAEQEKKKNEEVEAKQ